MIWIGTIIGFLVLLALAAALLINTAPQWIISKGLTHLCKKAGLERKTLEIDGSVLAYLDGGNGEAVVMLHGFGGDKENFVPFASALEQELRIVIPDLYDFGESSLPPQAEPTLDSETRRVLLLMDTLKIGRAHFVGNSMGGQLAIYLAAHFPERVQSLCLISPAGLWHGPQTELMRQLQQTGKNPLVVRSVEDFKRSMALGMLNPPKLPYALLKELAKPRIAHAEKEERLFRMFLDYPLDDMLEQIKVPVLIIFGAHDRIIDPATAEYMQKKLADSEVAIIPKAAHVAMYERPIETARHYEDFLDMKISNA